LAETILIAVQAVRDSGKLLALYAYLTSNTCLSLTHPHLKWLTWKLHASVEVKSCYLTNRWIEKRIFVHHLWNVLV